MFSLRLVLSAASLPALAGCVLTPTQQTFSMTARGNYQALADCTYLRLSASNASWRKEDLLSQRRIRLVSQVSTTVGGYVEFAPDGANATRIVSFMHEGLLPGSTAAVVRPAVAACGG